MLILGEPINSSRERIAQAVEERNSYIIQEEARRQVEAGVDYIDLNAGTSLNDELNFHSNIDSYGKMQNSYGKMLNSYGKL